ncbi:hypothetical protein [Haloferax massiliensis]|uniref:hypothetical protein n=1 Tax=Haloferax massiliensis TaxID=1476858 RepID=UPI0011121B2E|nr:hypothetical protein [Haloferax massiliensis]
MSSLVPVGLALDLVGATLLLGPEVETIGKAARRFDPIHRSLVYGFEYIREETSEDGEYAGSVTAGQIRLLPFMHFMNSRIDQTISRKDNISYEGNRFLVNGDRTYLPEERKVEGLNETTYTKMVSVSTAHRLIFEAQRRRVYVYGVSLLAIGFGLQIVAQFVSQPT